MPAPEFCPLGLETSGLAAGDLSACANAGTTNIVDAIARALMIRFIVSTFMSGSIVFSKTPLLETPAALWGFNRTELICTSSSGSSRVFQVGICNSDWLVQRGGWTK